MERERSSPYETRAKLASSTASEARSMKRERSSPPRLRAKLATLPSAVCTPPPLGAKRHTFLLWREVEAIFCHTDESEGGRAFESKRPLSVRSERVCGRACVPPVSFVRGSSLTCQYGSRAAPKLALLLCWSLCC